MEWISGFTSNWIAEFAFIRYRAPDQFIQVTVSMDGYTYDVVERAFASHPRNFLLSRIVERHQALVTWDNPLPCAKPIPWRKLLTRRT